MQKGGKQNKKRIAILQISIFRDKEGKVKYTELKTCRCQYAEMKKGKENIQNPNTAAANMQRRGKENKI